ncbi:hypothetical protein C4D60_Mb02t21520 [Musa balbisiana]|uniref:CCHC-type domain-containing protein n=1 Tax=Musa balbisiana TaxID=52838 RepID=A0A4S8ICD1_MUSBA|nr:hypothetical protein C4D60_Mb02t21520 [Musa balbisiana]
MSESSRSPPRDRKMRTERVSYRDAPYRRDFRRGSRDCMGPLMICHNCGGWGHMAFECPSGRFLDRGFRRF